MDRPIAIIGGGPSGLAAACALVGAGLTRTVIFESGGRLDTRRHRIANDLATGVGGAGLFSDGKFSYFPSGSELYKLEDLASLRSAYDWCTTRLRAIGIQTEPFPSPCKSQRDRALPPRDDGGEGVKRYPSHYSSLEQRTSLIQSLTHFVGPHILTGATVTRVEPLTDGYVVWFHRAGTESSVKVAAIVLAIGRAGGLEVHEGRLDIPVPLCRKRFELGIRIESRSSHGFLCRMSSSDVKRVWHAGGAEIRTFCTCRCGEIWHIPLSGFSALSGRSDGHPTKFSNFGLLARFQGPNLDRGQMIWTSYRAARRTETAVYQPLSEFLPLLSSGSHVYWPAPSPRDRPWYPRRAFQHGSIRNVMGHDLYTVIATALLELLRWSPDLLHPDTMCLFPAIEGVGFYPQVNGDLRVANEMIWVAGDVVGIFRGLIPALVSGYHAGLMAAKTLTKRLAQPSGASLS